MIRTSEAQFDYFLKAKSQSKTELMENLKAALLADDYRIVTADVTKAKIIGVRETTLWEWKSIVGIYFQETNGIYHIYFMNRITQDITGGFNFNRALEVAGKFCEIHGNGISPVGDYNADK